MTNHVHLLLTPQRSVPPHRVVAAPTNAPGGERFQKEIEIALGRRVSRGQAGRPTNSPIEAANQLDLL